MSTVSTCVRPPATTFVDGRTTTTDPPRSRPLPAHPRTSLTIHQTSPKRHVFSSSGHVTVNDCDRPRRTAARHGEATDRLRGSGPRSARRFILGLGHALWRADRRVGEADRRQARLENPGALLGRADERARRRLRQDPHRAAERLGRVLARAADGWDDDQRHLRQGLRRLRGATRREGVVLLTMEEGAAASALLRFITVAALPTGPRRIGPPVAADKSDVEAAWALDPSPVFLLTARLDYGLLVSVPDRFTERLGQGPPIVADGGMGSLITA